MATKARRKWVLVAGALILTAFLILALGGRGPRQFAFVRQLHGKRDTQWEGWMKAVARKYGGSPKSTVERCYSFSAPAEKVAIAMTHELTNEGWSSIGQDSLSFAYQRDGEVVIFDELGLGLKAEATCRVVVYGPPNWLRDQWEALMVRLGIE